MSQTEAAQTESIDGRDPANESQKKVKSRRPASKSNPLSLGSTRVFILSRR